MTPEVGTRPQAEDQKTGAQSGAPGGEGSRGADKPRGRVRGDTRVVGPLHRFYANSVSIRTGHGLVDADYRPCEQAGRGPCPWRADRYHPGSVSLGTISGPRQALGLSTRGIMVHHDQDGVYLVCGWLRQLLTKDSIRGSYSQTGAKVTSTWSRSMVGSRRKTNCGSGSRRI